ncbi:MAG: NUDIX domain-containing protein [Comamonadaceae bacterium]|nr:MAG: NUDIX domain-containing protein [Comamonadaceae bacterium]
MEKTQPTAHLSFDRPLVTVDVVVFTVRQERLQVLLVQRPAAPREPFPGAWALPGGFIDTGADRTLLACARRKLKEKTGVASPYLEQLGSWGSATRDPRGWSATHAYFALISMPAEREPQSGAPVQQWMPIEDAMRRKLAFDHGEILEAALARLRSKAEYTSLPAFLLPEPITLPQLQQTYEIVLGRVLDKSAFRRRMLDAGFLEEAGSVVGPGGRPAQGYGIVDRSAATVFPRTFKSGEA